MATSEPTHVLDQPPPATGAEGAENNLGKLMLLVIFAGALAVLVLLHVPGINGTIYWPWHYRRIEWWRLYPAMLIGAIPFAISLSFLWARRLRPVRAIIGMMITTLLMQITIAGMASNPFDIGRIAQIVDDKMTTSYFTDATLLAAQPSIHPFLERYDSLMPHFTFHSREKPPGPILYYTFFLKAIADRGSPGDAALLGGIVAGLLSTLSIPACYWLIHLLSGDARTALIGAAYFSVAPCMIIFLPMFDAIYPLLSCAMIGLWIRAIRDNRSWASAAFGAVLALAIFFSYAILVLGTLLAGFGIVEMIQTRRAGAKQFTIHSIIAILVAIAIYGFLWLASGFNPIATFRQAVINQRELLAHLDIPRPWPNVIPFDVQDFLLGSAWISLPLIIFWCLRTRASARNPVHSFVLLGLTQIGIVALTGLLPGETSRVWTFLQPLVMLPIALELSKWNPRHVAIVLGLVAVLTAVMAQNMIFVMLG